MYINKHPEHALTPLPNSGAEVRVVDGTYDDAVRQCQRDAQANGWQVVSDVLARLRRCPALGDAGLYHTVGRDSGQLAAQGPGQTTHIFVQAGVGAFAAAMIGFYAKLFGTEAPTAVVVEPRTAACLYLLQAGDGQPHPVTGDLKRLWLDWPCGVPSPLAWQLLGTTPISSSLRQIMWPPKGCACMVYRSKGDPFVVSGESGAVTLGALTFMMEYEGAAVLREQLQ